MNSKDIPKPVFSSDDVNALDYPTPYFLYSPQELLKTIQIYRDNLPAAEIFYAIKANSEPEILQTVFDSGCGFEVASSGELDYLKKLKVPGNKIIFGTSVKSAAAIRYFADYGVDRFAFDSEQEIDKIAKLAPGAKVYARALVDDSDSVFTMSAKFGVPPTDAGELLIKAKAAGLKPYGISFNVGSQARDPKAWANAIGQLTPTIAMLQRQGIELEVLNLGGGYPNHYLKDDGISSPKEILSETRRALSKLPYAMEIIVEPGRGIIATSMALVVSVVAKIKRSNGVWLYVDAGAYNALLETMAYQGSIRYQMTALMQSANPDIGAKQEFILTGPTGDSLDVIDQQTLLPSSIDVGDKLVIHDTGAYSLALASAFNGFPKPPVYKLGD